MKFEVTGLSRSGLTEVKVTHGDESLTFAAQGYNNAAIHDASNLFVQMNDFIARHPGKVADDLFMLYKEAYVLLADYQDVNTMTEGLQEVVRKMYDLIDLEDVLTYVRAIPGLRLPETIHDDYTSENMAMENYQSRTYRTEDYYELCAAAMAHRLMVPMWGWIMWLIRKEVGNKFKEEYATLIVTKSKLDKWRGMEKLRDFVKANTGSGGDDLPIAALMGGIATDSCPEHLTALAVVRKLAIEPVDSNHNLVSIIYNYVTGTKNRIETRFMGNVRLKRISNNDRSEDDNSAVTDAWKLTEKVADGTRSPYIVYTEDVERFMQHVSRKNHNEEGEYDARIFRSCMANYRKMLTADVYPHQIWLTMLVVASKRRAMTAPAVTTLDKQALLRAMLVTQARLWEWGMYELAALMTVTVPGPDREKLYPHTEPQRRIPNESRPLLNELYPYYRVEPGAKYDRSILDDPNRRPNEAAKAIEIIFNAIRENVWMLHGPKQLNDLIGWPTVEYPYRASGNIRIALTELIFKINE